MLSKNEASDTFLRLETYWDSSRRILKNFRISLKLFKLFQTFLYLVKTPHELLRILESR